MITIVIYIYLRLIIFLLDNITFYTLYELVNRCN